MVIIGSGQFVASGNDGIPPNVIHFDVDLGGPKKTSSSSHWTKNGTINVCRNRPRKKEARILKEQEEQNNAVHASPSIVWRFCHVHS